MTKEEALSELTRHIHQLGMLMPQGWLEIHGDGSPFMEAYQMAQDALKKQGEMEARLAQSNKNASAWTRRYCELLESVTPCNQLAWISTKDTTQRPPERFLGVSKYNGEVVIMERSGYECPDRLVGGWHLTKDVAYWMPIPEVPEEEVE